MATPPCAFDMTPHMQLQTSHNQCQNYNPPVSQHTTARAQLPPTNLTNDVLAVLGLKGVSRCK